jgi:long-chain acyl-CoA synthetase
MSNVFATCYLAGRKDFQSMVAVLPIHHMFQLTTGIQCPLYLGVTICIGKGVKYFAQSIKEYKPSIVVLVPLAIETIRKNIWAGIRKQNKQKQIRRIMLLSRVLLRIGIDVRQRLFKRLRCELGGNLHTIISGGASLNEEIIREFKTWGIDIYNGYGITECSPVVSCNMPKKTRKASVGIPAPESFCKVKIVDGEILVRGNIVMKGYFNDQQATQEAFVEGWFRTGDLGYLDDDGYLYITGRAKNLIVLSNGENVSPEELETIFSSIDGVKDIVVTEKTVNSNTVLTAIIIPEENLHQIGTAEMQRMFETEFERLNIRLPSYKRIYRIEMRMADFEKTAAGKTKRIKENYETWKPKS